MVQDEDLQRIEEAFRWRAGSNKSGALRKCEGKRYNGTYLSLIAGGKSARNSETELYALPHLGLIGNM